MKLSKFGFIAVLFFSISALSSPNCPNRPTGASTVLDTSFNTSDGEGQLWEIYPGAGVILQPSGTPASSPNASASIFPAGQSVGGQQTIWPKPGAQQALNNLYMCMTWKMNADFVGLRTNNKLVFLAAQDFTFGRAGVNGLLSVPARDGYPPTSFQMVFNHNTGSLDNSHVCAADLGLVCKPNVADTPLYPNVWYTVEAQVISSTCSTCRNGTVRWWINGVLQGNYTNLNYGDGIINQWQINHTWDGSLDKQCGPPTNPANAIGRDCQKDQVHYFDHVTLASVGGLVVSAPTPAPTPVPAPGPVVVAPAPAPAPAPRAPASTSPISFKTTLKAENSGKCVDAGSSTATGTTVTQSSCSGVKNQNFIFADKGSGYFEIRAEHSNNCVENLNSSTADGARLVQASCTGQANQLFRLENKDSGKQKIHSKTNDKCIQARSKSSKSSIQVYLSTCMNGTNENFFMTTTSLAPAPTPAPTPAPAPGPVVVAPAPAPVPVGAIKTPLKALHSGKCVDAGSNTTTGTLLTQSTCSGAKNQSFIFTDKGSGYFEIRAEHSNNCIENLNSSTADGASLVQASCTGQNNQLFRLESKGANQQKIHSKVNDKCLDVSGVSMNDGAQVFLWTCWSSGNEIFITNIP